MELRERAIYKTLYENLLDIFQNSRICAELTYLKVRLSLRLVRSLRTIRGRFRRFPVGVVPLLERSRKAGVTADLVPPRIWFPRTKSASGSGPPGPNLQADLVPHNYILADLVPPPKYRLQNSS